MLRIIKVIGLILLGCRLEHYSQVLLVKHGFAHVDQYGNVRKSKDWDEKIDQIVTRIVPTKASDGTY